MSDESGHIMAVTPRRPLVPWRVAAGGGWAAAAAAWPVLGAAFALSGIAGVTLATVLLELSLTGGLLLGIFQLRRRGIPFRFRDQQGPTMTVLTGATLTCAVPALVWSTSEVLHNPAFSAARRSVRPTDRLGLDERTPGLAEGTGAPTVVTSGL